MTLLLLQSVALQSVVLPSVALRPVELRSVASQLHQFLPHRQLLIALPCNPGPPSDSTNPFLCRTNLPPNCRVLRSSQTPRRQGSVSQVWTGNPIAALHAQPSHRGPVCFVAVGIPPPHAWQASACGRLADGTSESRLRLLLPMGLLLPKTGSPPCSGLALDLARSPKVNPHLW